MRKSLSFIGLLRIIIVLLIVYGLCLVFSEIGMSNKFLIGYMIILATAGLVLEMHPLFINTKQSNCCLKIEVDNKIKK